MRLLDLVWLRGNCILAESQISLIRLLNPVYSLDPIKAETPYYVLAANFKAIIEAYRL